MRTSSVYIDIVNSIKTHLLSFVKEKAELARTTTTIIISLTSNGTIIQRQMGQ